MLKIAKEFGQLPDTVETQMSEWWQNRAWELIQGEAIASNRQMQNLKKK